MQIEKGNAARVIEIKKENERKGDKMKGKIEI